MVEIVAIIQTNIVQERHRRKINVNRFPIVEISKFIVEILDQNHIRQRGPKTAGKPPKIMPCCKGKCWPRSPGGWAQDRLGIMGGQGPQSWLRARGRPGGICRGGIRGHGLVKSLEVQFAKRLSVAAKVEIQRRRKRSKVSPAHPRGGARAPPKNQKIGRFQINEFCIRNPMVAAPRAGKFIQAILMQNPQMSS